MPPTYELEESPYLKANFFSRIFFCWTSKIFRLGSKRNLTLKDLYKANPEDQSGYLGDQLEKHWNEELEIVKIENTKLHLDLTRVDDDGEKELIKKKFVVQPSLYRAIRKTFMKKYLCYGLLTFLEECILKIGGPVALGFMVKYFINKPTWELYPGKFGYIMAGALCLALIGVNLTTHPYFYNVLYCGMRVRTACSALVYRKAIKLSQESLGKTAIGQIVGILAADVNQFDAVCLFLHYLWVGPLQMIIVGVVLYFYIGYCCFMAVGLLLIYVPFQLYMGTKFSKLRGEAGAKAGRRIHLMSEIIGAIKLIKMYAWELLFTKVTEVARKEEIHVLRKGACLRAVNFAFFLLSGKIAVFVTLILYVLTGNDLTIEKTFVVVALINNAKLIMTFYLPSAIAELAEVKSALKRLTDFLTMDEQKCLNVPEEEQTHVTVAISKQSKTTKRSSKKLSQIPIPLAEEDRIVLHDVSATWEKRNVKRPTLENISFSVKCGELLAITGSVGSGKTTILQVILKELPIIKGRLEIFGKIAYVAQDPWLVTSSVRENILFGRPFEPHWYTKVVEACGLVIDFKLFPYGDQTLVSEKGGFLSGGQKARITLARAVYADADLLLLDDPLAAVDTKVGLQLFNSIQSGILASKARILVTHQLQYMQNVDRIIVLDEGRIEAQGTFQELVDQGINFNQIDDDYKETKTQELNKNVKMLNPQRPNPVRDGRRPSSIIIQNQVLQEMRQQKLVSLKNPNTPNKDKTEDVPKGKGANEEVIVIQEKSEEHDLEQGKTSRRKSSVKGGKNNRVSVTASSESKQQITPSTDPASKSEVVRKKSSMTAPNDRPHYVTYSHSSLHHGHQHHEIPSHEIAAMVEEQVHEVQLEIEEETSGEGIPCSLYCKYFGAGNNFCAILLFIILNLITQFLFALSEYWIAIWTLSEEISAKKRQAAKLALKLNTTTTTTTTTPGPTTTPKELFEKSNPMYYVLNDQMIAMYGFSVLIGCLMIFTFIRNMQYNCLCISTSVFLHKKMFNSVLRAPMSFFDQNPSGRILTRFSKDMAHIDQLLPATFMDVIIIGLSIVAVVAIVSVINQYLLVAAAIIAIIFICLRRYYLKTARSMKHLEGLSRSPIFSHMGATLYGITTIRAFKVEGDFIRQFESHLDLHTSSWALFLATTRSFAVWLDWCCTFYIISVVWVFAVLEEYNLLKKWGGGMGVALAVSMSMTLSGMIQWGVRQSAELESQLMSAQHVMEYSKIKPEAALESHPEKAPDEDWPERGEIRYEHVTLQFGNNAPVLKDITVAINPKEKVGVCGRSGAGKSTLLTVLFRLSEPRGRIIIDGIDVMGIGLHDLRSKISIIPQEPVLFSGTVRKNLDPFDLHNDSEIWNALYEAHLGKDIRMLPDCLNAKVVEGGANFSVGQRQLMCLARAILENNNILVLDEATANVDLETDRLIQNTVAKIGKNCTVLSIAHRLHTIMDSDKMIVMDEGKIVEFDEPWALLQNPNSVLRNLVEHTGEDTTQDLMNQAKAAHEKRANPSKVTLKSVKKLV